MGGKLLKNNLGGNGTSYIWAFFDPILILITKSILDLLKCSPVKSTRKNPIEWSTEYIAAPRPLLLSSSISHKKTYEYDLLYMFLE